GLRIGGRPGGGSKPGGDIRRATIGKIDLGRMVLTLRVEGKDQEVRLIERTQGFGAQGTDLKERLARFKEGTPVLFKSEKRDGRNVIVGLKKDDGTPVGPGGQPPPKIDLSNFKPLPELGTGEYHGFKGGLYPDGKNERPSAHEAAGRALARQ